MKTYYPYNLTEPADIENEEHIIIGGKIRLSHIPKKNSLTVRGFIEASSAANLLLNEFFCFYNDDSLYRESNCLVYFNDGLNGQHVFCTYKAIGSIVTADDMNEIARHINSENTLSTIPSDVEGAFWFEPHDHSLNLRYGGQTFFVTLRGR